MNFESQLFVLGVQGTFKELGVAKFFLVLGLNGVLVLAWLVLIVVLVGVSSGLGSSRHVHFFLHNFN